MNAKNIIYAAAWNIVDEPIDIATSVAKAILAEVDRRAEDDMRKGNPVCGAHQRAVEEIRKELEE